jgi:hypothetical protein
MSIKPLEGLIVVALEQAVAAPYCRSRLADAGARAFKIERPEGDFARNYDAAVQRESFDFVWLNRGKVSLFGSAVEFKTVPYLQACDWDDAEFKPALILGQQNYLVGDTQSS